MNHHAFEFETSRGHQNKTGILYSHIHNYRHANGIIKEVPFFLDCIRHCPKWQSLLLLSMNSYSESTAWVVMILYLFHLIVFRNPENNIHLKETISLLDVCINGEKLLYLYFKRKRKACATKILLLFLKTLLPAIFCKNKKVKPF